MKVVRAQAEHLDDLWKLTRELYEDGVRVYPFSAAGMNQVGHLHAFHRVLGWVLDGSAWVIMVYDGVNPVGYMHLQYLPFVGSENSTIASSVGFYIRPDYRRGRATILLYREARRVLLAGGATHVQAVVLTANTETSTLYEAHGYEPVATIYQRDLRKVNPHGRIGGSQEVEQVGCGGDENHRHREDGLSERSDVSAGVGARVEHPAKSAYADSFCC